jgi:hypothetical protein
MLTNFVDKCTNKDAKKHLYESIAMIQTSISKMKSISEILETQTYAACA